VTRDGKVAWQVAVPAEYGGKAGTWGWSTAPLIHDGKVIFTISSKDGAMIALNAETGEKVWLSEPLKGDASYVSPNLIERNGKKQIVGMNSDFIFGVNPATGKIEWQSPLAELKTFGEGGGSRLNIHCVTPVLVEDFVIGSTGYEVGTYAYKINDTLTEAKLVWMNRDIDIHLGGIVAADGTIWGTGTRNSLAALDAKTGEAISKEAWSGKGAALIAADGMLYAYNEKGALALFEMNKDKFVKKGEFDITKGLMQRWKRPIEFAIGLGSRQHWAHPVICDGVLYVRHGTALIAYDVKNF